MSMPGSRLAIIVVLIIAGLYFLLFHSGLPPVDHEAVGLGTGSSHFGHAIFGIVLIAGAFLVWRKSRMVTPTPAKPTP